MDKLLHLHHRGIFPGPGETLESFIQRAEILPAKQGFPCPGALHRLHAIFRVSVDWVDVVVRSKGLLPWEAAATWIETVGETRTCQIQMKNSLVSRLYPQEEVLAHEMVHAMRLMFDENRFEEVLAYRTSENGFRRYFGPLFSSARDLIFLLTLFLLPWLFYGLESVFDLNLGGGVLSLLPFVGLGLGVLRLSRTQSVFKAALCNLDEATEGKGTPLAIALCLTDKEIALFARVSAREIRAIAEREKEDNPRWLQLYNVYFSRT